LRRYAGITNQAVLAGVDDHLEIWEPSRWEAAMDGLRDIGDGPDGTSASSGE
jgi:DNA-binding transcriptional regulator/RsmH inhibitor MraZ